MGEIRSFNDLVERVQPQVREIDSDALAALIETGDRALLLIDVRENDEFRHGHNAGALGIGRGVLEYHIEDEAPDRSTRIVLYCRGGKRSVLAAAALQDMGYENVCSLVGGFRAWTADPTRDVSHTGEPIHHGDH